MDLLVFLIYLSACFTAAATGALFPTGEWYKSLDKPIWTPPDWVFPIAWAIFYTVLAIVGARVSNIDGNKYAVAFWSLHIALNTLWTPVVFGARKLKAGMIIIVLLWLASAGTIYHTFVLDRFSGLIIMPYIIWVTFATALNFSLVKRNPLEL